jgi:catechol 2,3-dioxygenase-like lactoylglutathione lyase family enzyme
MPKIRHIALNCEDPETTAEFYKRAFDMVEVGRNDSPDTKRITLTDGDLSLTVLKYLTDERADRGDGMGPVKGLHHIGFWVEDIEDTRRRLQEVEAELVRNLGDPESERGQEDRWRGPDKEIFDVRASGWNGARPPA